MVKQIILNFDATGFEGFESPNDFFAFCSKTAKDANGVHLKQHYQAADMGMSPSQWSQKLNNLNNTGIMLDESVSYSMKTKDWRWVDYVNWLRAESQNDNIEELIRQRDRLNGLILKAAK